jgi:hypothetical protein
MDMQPRIIWFVQSEEPTQVPDFGLDLLCWEIQKSGPGSGLLTGARQGPLRFGGPAGITTTPLPFDVSGRISRSVVMQSSRDGGGGMVRRFISIRCRASVSRF